TYAAIVERTALLRRLIGSANEIARLALTRDEATSAVADAQELLFSLSESTLHRDIVPLDVALRRYAEQIDARGDLRVGIKTGFETLDKKTGGLQPSDLILIAGRPGLGKTSLALNVVEHAAVVEHKTCAMFSMEMSEMQVVQRGTEPMLSDLRESGALEADADLVMFLWQKDRKDRDEGIVRLKLAKHRNGPTGDFDLHFQSELTRFRDLGETREVA